MLSVVYAESHIQALYAEYHYVECRHAECHYVVCHYAECRGAKTWTGLSTLDVACV
jgi:hypothetical protein